MRRKIPQKERQKQEGKAAFIEAIFHDVEGTKERKNGLFFEPSNLEVAGLRS